MTKKNIPGIGEQFSGYVPAVRKTLHVTFGADTTADVIVGETGVYELVNVDMPIIVFKTWSQVETAFTSSVTATVGDTGSAARYHTDTGMAPASSGAILVAGAVNTVPSVLTAIPINVTIGGATVAAGLASIYIEYSELND
jgi:hypothetical protein